MRTRSSWKEMVLIRKEIQKLEMFCSSSCDWSHENQLAGSPEKSSCRRGHQSRLSHPLVTPVKGNRIVSALAMPKFLESCEKYFGFHSQASVTCPLFSKA